MGMNRFFYRSPEEEIIGMLQKYNKIVGYRDWVLAGHAGGNQTGVTGRSQGDMKVT